MNDKDNKTIQTQTSSHNPPLPKPGLQAEPARVKQDRPLVLRFSPTVWAKLIYFQDRTDNEIGGFGITEPDDLLFVKEFVPVRQQVTCVSVKFDDAAVADFFDRQVDMGRRPEQFARIWIHTHPGDSPEPSATDENTFLKVFGKCQWAVMFVLAEAGHTCARLRLNIGPGGQIHIPVQVDFNCSFEQTDHELWEAEYRANVKEASWADTFSRLAAPETKEPPNDSNSSHDFISKLEKMEPFERRIVLDELADRPDLWDEESEAVFL